MRQKTNGYMVAIYTIQDSMLETQSVEHVVGESLNVTGGRNKQSGELYAKS